jgi:hypothetical protein
MSRPQPRRPTRPRPVSDANSVADIARASGGGLRWPPRYYDHVPEGSLAHRIRSLPVEGLRQLLDYEQEHSNRLPAAAPRRRCADPDREIRGR